MYIIYILYIYIMCSAAQGRYFFRGFKYLGEPLEIENQCHFNNIYMSTNQLPLHADNSLPYPTLNILIN